MNQFAVISVNRASQGREGMAGDRCNFHEKGSGESPEHGKSKAIVHIFSLLEEDARHVQRADGLFDLAA